MNRSPIEAFLLTMPRVDRDAGEPLYRQIYSDIREGILQGRLVPGLRLPSSRDLAELLGVSRNTVLNAFDQLLAEGYLETRVGAGTFVTESLPESYMNVYRRKTLQSPASQRSQSVQSNASVSENSVTTGRPGRLHQVFPHGIPDLEHFPFHIWSRLTAKRLREISPYRFGYYAGRGGYQPLVGAITGYLGAARAVQCDPQQVIIVAGSQHGLYLASHILLESGDRAWIEDPGYLGARTALAGAGARLIPVPIDDEGFDLAAARHAGQARLAYVTPSHQFPLGYTMSLARRTRLLQWAAESDGWIVEDDYDSEFRYSGAPLASLQGLDIDNRVIYAGTFSKTLFPGLRLGYLVVPEDLIDAFISARNAMTLAPPFLAQAVLSDFIEEGHLTRHIRRMRTRYARRRQALVASLEETLGGVVQLGPNDAGLHLTVWLPEGVDDLAVWREAQEKEVTVLPLSRLCLAPPQRQGLVLGFAMASVEEIRAGVRRLATVITNAIKKT